VLESTSPEPELDPSPHPLDLDRRFVLETIEFLEQQLELSPDQQAELDGIRASVVNRRRPLGEPQP
jgi:hypothetical protein